MRLKSMLQRSYDGADVNRLFRDWITSSSSANYEIYGSIRLLRDRCRELVRNDPYAAGAVNTLVTEILGEAGFKFQSKVMTVSGKKLDDKINKTIEALFAEVTTADRFDVLGRNNFDQQMRLAVRTWAESGEVLIRKYRKSYGGSPIPYAIKVLEPDYLVDDHELRLNDASIRIELGIQFDRDGRRMGYWLYKQHPGDRRTGTQATTEDIEFVPARDLDHIFICDRPEQCRGIPPLAVAMIRLHFLQDTEDAELVASKLAALVGGVVTTDDVEGFADSVGTGNDTLESGTTETSETQPVREFEPGMLLTLLPGEKFDPFIPTRPNAALPDFTKHLLRGISAGILGLTYSGLSNDFSDASYSSHRAEKLKAIRAVRFLQSEFKQQLHLRQTREIIETAWLSGRLALPNYPLQEARYHSYEFTSPSFDWIDPQKDIEASVAAIEAGLSTYTIELGALNRDFDEIVAQRAREKEALKEAGLSGAQEEDAQQTELKEGLTAVRSAIEALSAEVARVAQAQGDITRHQQAEVAQLVRVQQDRMIAIENDLGELMVGVGEILRAPAKKKDHNCVKGKPCKGRCIPQKNNCRDGSPPAKQAKPKTKPKISAPAAQRVLPLNRQGLAAREKEIAQLAKKYRVDTDAAKANVKKLLAETNVFMKVPDSDVMALVLGDRFKTAHELGGRPGAPPPGAGKGNYLDARARVESKVLAIAADTHGKDRPKYGYLGSADTNSPEHLQVEGAYGAITVEFKSSVKDRSTFTGADSFKSGIASSINDPSLASIVTSTERGRDVSINDISQVSRAAKAKTVADLALDNARRGNAYLEAQIHGDLTPDDVKAIHFRPTSARDYPTPELIAAAKAKGIELYINGKKADYDSIPAFDQTPEMSALRSAIKSGDVAAISKTIKQATKLSATETPGQADAVQSVLAKAAGYAEKPRVVTAAEFDKLQADNTHHSLRRGVHDAGSVKSDQILEDTRSGDYFTGSGVFGNGYYFAHASNSGAGALQVGSTTKERISGANITAKVYAIGGKNPKLMRALLDPEARIAPSDQIIQQQKNFVAKINKQKEEAYAKALAKGPRITQAEVDNFNSSIDAIEGAAVNRLPGKYTAPTRTVEIAQIDYKKGKSTKRERVTYEYEVDGSEYIVAVQANFNFSRRLKPDIDDLFDRRYSSKAAMDADFDRVLREVAIERSVGSTQRKTTSDPSEKALAAANKARQKYDQALLDLGLDGPLNPESVSSRFAIAQGIDAVSVSTTTGQQTNSQYINVLNRSKIIVDQNNYSPSKLK